MPSNLAKFRYSDTKRNFPKNIVFILILPRAWLEIMENKNQKNGQNPHIGWS